MTGIPEQRARHGRPTLAPVDDRTDLVRGREALGVVKVIGPAMTVLLVVFAVFDAATHPDQFWWRVPTDVVPAIVLAAILWWQRRGHVTPQNAGWYVTVGSLVVSSSILVTVVLGGQVPIMIYLLIMTMVNGACALTVRQLVLAQTVPVLGPLVAMVSVGGLITSDSFADWIALWLVTLAASIAVFVSRERGFREMARIEELLEQQAIEDPVTGLGTRRALEQMFPVVRSAAEVAGLEVFLVFVDVDGLKTVNDALLRLEVAARRIEERPEVAAAAKAVREQLMENALYSDYLLRGVELQEAEVRAWYDAHRGDWVAPERRHVAHIVAATREAAEALRARLDNGEPFEKVAAASSQDPQTAKAGGDLGWVTAKETPAEFAPVMQLASGEVSAPLQSSFGWHLVKVLQVDPARQLAYEEVADRLRQQLLDRKRTEKRAEWIRRLRAATPIEIDSKAIEAFAKQTAASS